MPRTPPLTRFLATAAVATAVAVAAATSIAAGPPAGAAYSSSRQPAGTAQHAPRAVSLIGTDLHLADGTVVALPGAAGAEPVLLGTVRSGWVVASGGAFRLVGVDGTVTRIAGRNRTDLYVSEALSDDGRQIVSSAVDQADQLSVDVVDLQGEEVFGDWYPNLGGDVMDADDGKVYVGGQKGVHVIDGATDVVDHVISSPVALVDVKHDTVFVSSRSNPWMFGPTSLTDPGAASWRARFDPVAVSPDGSYVVGREGTVRAMDDGHIIRRVPVPAPGDEQRFLGWGSNRRVLLETTSGPRHILVSCVVPRGACHRVGSTTGLVSIPTSHGGPYRQP